MRNIAIKGLKIYYVMKKRKAKAIYALCHYTLFSFIPITIIKQVADEYKSSSINDTESIPLEGFVDNFDGIIYDSLETINDIKEKEKMKEELTPYFSTFANFYGVDQNLVGSLFFKHEEEIINSSDPDATFLSILNQKIDLNQLQNTSTFLNISSKSGKQVIEEVKQSEIGAYYEKYGAMYGVDPNLLMAQAMQESGLKHDDFNPAGAYGISQIEHTLFGETISVYNYETNQLEKLAITEEGAMDLETNIQYGAARMQEQLRKYHNNIYIALQAYNYGLVMDSILSVYAKENGLSFDQVTMNLNDFGWLEKVDDVHINPQNYIDWEYDTYGDNEYISNIMRYVDTDIIINKDEEGNDVLTNLKNNKSICLDGKAIASYIEKIGQIEENKIRACF